MPEKTSAQEIAEAIEHLIYVVTEDAQRDLKEKTPRTPEDFANLFDAKEKLVMAVERLQRPN